jgi:hypothetical protein
MDDEDVWTEHKRNPLNRTLVSTLPAHFWEALRLLRRHESGPVRSVAEVRAGLAVRGYHLETSTYRAIEAGLCLPAEPVRFLDALAEYLELSDTEVVGLTWRLAYEILCRELGEELTHELFLDATPPIPPELPPISIQSGGADSTVYAPTPSSDVRAPDSPRKPAASRACTCNSRKYAELRHGRRTRLTNAIGPGRA